MTDYFNPIELAECEEDFQEWLAKQNVGIFGCARSVEGYLDFIMSDDGEKWFDLILERRKGMKK